MAKEKKAIVVQGVRYHDDDDEHLISFHCPNLGCGFRQSTDKPGVVECVRCPQLAHVLAHDQWKERPPQQVLAAPVDPVQPTPEPAAALAQPMPAEPTPEPIPAQE